MSILRPFIEVLSWIAGILGTALAYFLFFSTPVPSSEAKISEKTQHQSFQSERTIDVSTGISPSFDCPRASNKVERLICATPELAVLDLSLANSYRNLWVERTNAEFRVQLKDAQNHWIRNVRDRCSDVECLKITYDLRISELRNARR